MIGAINETAPLSKKAIKMLLDKVKSKEHDPMAWRFTPRVQWGKQMTQDWALAKWQAKNS